MAAPRVLSLTFEFHIPEGLRTDVRSSRIEKAVARISGAVQAMAGDVFPWADRLVITNSWSYRWWSESEDVSLQLTEANTVHEPAPPKADAEPVEQG
jgi:hypothetical protein